MTENNDFANSYHMLRVPAFNNCIIPTSGRAVVPTDRRRHHHHDHQHNKIKQKQQQPCGLINATFSASHKKSYFRLTSTAHSNVCVSELISYCTLFLKKVSLL